MRSHSGQQTVFFILLLAVGIAKLLRALFEVLGVVDGASLRPSLRTAELDVLLKNLLSICGGCVITETT